MQALSAKLDLPYNLQCQVRTNCVMEIEHSLSSLLNHRPASLQDSGIAESREVTLGQDTSLPGIIAICSVLLFRYTSSPSFQYTVSFKAQRQQSRKINLLVSVPPDSDLLQIVIQVKNSLLSASHNGQLPVLSHVDYICLQDEANESAEVVGMSIAGGLYFRFHSYHNIFTTTFSFAKILSFSEPDAIDITSHWESLLLQVKADPLELAYKKVGDINILSHKERSTLLTNWNNCPQPELYDMIGDVTLLHMLFERQVELHPENVAINHEDISNPVKYTYREANGEADKVAIYLMSNSKNFDHSPPTTLENEFIAHLFPRCAESYICMLGILKSGAAYVPLDVSFPMDRVAYILRDCKAKSIVTTADIGTKLREYQIGMKGSDQAFETEILIWDDICFSKPSSTGHLSVTEQGIRPRYNVNTHGACYVIYTSGSTGKPKGCIIEHRSAVNLVLSESSIFPLTDKDIVFQNFSLAFDASIETIWLAFFNGATLYVPTEDMMHSGAQLTQYITDAKVTMLSCVPTMLTMLSTVSSENEKNDDHLLPTVKTLIVGGEACSKDVIEKWSLNGQRRMVNTYGPTEATVIATYSDCRADDGVVSIGTAVPNYEVYILDPYLQPVPIGAVGELHIGGIGVARGYLNRPELNKEKFIENPFAPQFSGSPRLYKTGDLARYIPPSISKKTSTLPEGSIEYMGRIDMQVKIRGYRVELSEVEAVIIRCCSQVANAVAHLWKGDTSSSEEPEELFVAYIVTKKGITPFNSTAAKEELKQHLPEYMIPSVFQLIEEIPTLASGKVNRKMLPKPDEKIEPSEDGLFIDDSFSLTQRNVARLWAKLLVLDNVLNVLEADFFDLGGHSMIAAKLVSFLRSDPMYANVGMTDVYKYRTLKEFAERLDDISIQSESKNFECDDSQTYVSEKDFESGKGSPALRAYLRVIVKYLCMFIGLYCVFWFASLPLLIPSWTYNYVDINSVISMYTGTVSTAKTGANVLTQDDKNLEQLSSTLTTLMSTLLLLIVMNFTFVISPLLIILVKWIVIGRIKPGKYPLWGTYYWRWWLVHRLMKLLPLQLFKGWPVLVWFYRLLGAKIGKSVHIETSYISCLDMIHIGDDTSIGIDVFMEGFKVQMDKPDKNGRRQGWLIIGNIEIGTGCYIGSKSHLSINTVIPDDTLIGEFSMVPENAKLQHGKFYTASPIYECSREDIGCCFADAAQDPYSRAFSKDIDSRRLPQWLLSILECFSLFGLLSVMFASVIPSVLFYLFVVDRYGRPLFYTSDVDKNAAQQAIAVIWIILTPAISGILYVVTFCLEATAVKWILIGDLRTSTQKVIHVDSWLCMRKRFVDSLMQLSLTIVQSLYATLLLPVWFKMMGAKIGKHCEIATTRHITPDLLTLKDGSFVADAVYLGPHKVYQGWVQISEVTVGERSFLGNSAYVPTGVEIGNNCLLGALSRPPLPTVEDTHVSEDSIITQKIPDGKSYLGSPGMFLPRRATASGKVDIERTFEPPWHLYLARISIEIWRIILPPTLYFIHGFLTIVFMLAMKDSGWVSEMACWFLMPIAYILMAVVCAFVVLTFKYVLIGKYCAREAPLWSSFVWRTELTTALEEAFINIVLISHLRGTPFVNMWFRLLGGTIGRNVWMETTMVIEADLLTVGDDCAIGSECILQTHLFEDRVMKMSQLTIGNGCTIGSASITLYDGVMEDGATLGSFSLLMKGERLIANSNMAGIPAEPVSQNFK
ncbi:hypothetical protein BC943DRAFT_298296 [Umbelopsis sp. AD052]|nr:hypothetical protein BC943DRAFT_298296 [Umbelopsis sp. AD052]